MNIENGMVQELDRWVFVGDSGNDQAMFQHFTHSVGVANIRRFASTLTHLPRYITPAERGAGFAQVLVFFFRVLFVLENVLPVAKPCAHKTVGKVTAIMTKGA